MVSQHRHVPVIPSLEYLLLLLPLLLFRVPDAPAASPGARSIRDCYFQCAPDQAPPLDAAQCECGTPALSVMPICHGPVAHAPCALAVGQCDLSACAAAGTEDEPGRPQIEVRACAARFAQGSLPSRSDTPPGIMAGMGCWRLPRERWWPRLD